MQAAIFTRINLGEQEYDKLKEEFASECHVNTIQKALRYHSNSNLSQRIRARAKELLQQAADNVIVKPNN